MLVIFKIFYSQFEDQNPTTKDLDSIADSNWIKFDGNFIKFDHIIIPVWVFFKIKQAIF